MRNAETAQRRNRRADRRQISEGLFEATEDPRARNGVGLAMLKKVPGVLKASLTSYGLLAIVNDCQATPFDWKALRKGRGVEYGDCGG